MGAVTVAPLDPRAGTILFLVGLGYHIYGFALNEFLDREVDQGASDLARKPLVDGSLSPRGALLIAGSGLAMGLGGCAALRCSPQAWMIVCASVAAATAYNLTSKRLPFADLLVAAAMFLLVLLGAMTQGNPTSLTWILAGLMGLELLIQNTVAHLKDLESDRACGARNAALLLGARVDGQAIVVPLSLQAYLGAIRLAHLGLAALGVSLLPDSRGLVAAGLVLTQGPALWAFQQLVHKPPAQRREFLPHLFRHEFLTLLAMTVILLALTGWTGFGVFVVLPLAWGLATVRLVHGGELPSL